MDLSKAFDSVDHVILIKKLDHYGVKGGKLLWFEIYLNNRRQFITHDNSDMSFAKSHVASLRINTGAFTFSSFILI